MSGQAPTVLLEHHLKQLKLPTMLREYIGVLRLMEKHPLSALRRAVERALTVRAHSRDAVAQFLLPREPWRATTFRLDGREHLRRVKVAAPDLGAYRELLAGGPR